MIVGGLGDGRGDGRHSRRVDDADVDRRASANHQWPRAGVLTRYTEPELELNLLLNKLKLELPAQPPPKITAAPAASISFEGRFQ